MIPIKLTIEGLYSYQEKQTIDFTNLIEAGLFGIFGKVGSGKSSILEAISFGLYGESERLNKQDKRAYNMMNLKSKRSVIDFEFYNFKDEKYRIYREFRRNSKRFDEVKRGDAVLYRWQDGIWIPLPELNIEEVVGLSYENFKRTIIIPQGKFKEFIDLKGAERTRMMQDIFGLDRFDLGNKAKAIYSSAKESMNLLEGQLKSFALITKEEIEQKKTLHTQEGEKLAKVSTQFKKENEAYQKLKAVKDDFELLVSKKTEQTQLEESVPEKQKQKEELEKYEQVEKAFSVLLAEQGITDLKLKQEETKFVEVTRFAEELQQTFTKVTEELKVAQERFAVLEHLKAERYELDLIKGIKIAKSHKQALEERNAKGKQYLDAAEKALEQSRQLHLTKENELATTKTSRIDANMLMAIDGWFNQNRFIQKGIEDTRKKIASLNEEVHTVDNDIVGLKFKHIEHWEQEIEGFRGKFDVEQEGIEAELRQLSVAQQLTQYASDLHQGQPCPLCGSGDHPHILQGTDVSMAIQMNQDKLKNVKDRQQRLMKYERTARATFDKRHLLVTQYKEEQHKEQELLLQLQQHQLQFSWNLIEDGNEQQFIQLKQQAEVISKHVDELEKAHFKLTKEVDTNRTNVDKFRAELNHIELEEAKLDSEIESKSAQVVRLQIDTYIGLEDAILMQQIKQREDDIVSIDHSYKTLTQQFQELSPKLAEKQTEQKALQAVVTELKAAQERVAKDLAALVKTHKMESLAEVNALLNKKLDAKAIREGIQAFEVKLEVVRNQVKTLEEKLAKVSFDQEKFAKQQVEITALEAQVKEVTELVARLAGEVERLEKDFATKQELTKELAVVEKRVSNLGTLMNMFSGAGFVNYVSTIYLKNLCDMANNRFHRLTNNQLSLQLNENNDFEIIDYLNNGKSRSVKTLSGGQGFQVSLSLALALAESVQSLSKSNKNFFFIDEGFGTQDADSVNIVFETLSNLHKENRIVGIISHVEELQERIPMSLTIEKNEEKGSIIKVNS